MKKLREINGCIKNGKNVVNFLVQTMNDEIVHDFSFELLEAIKYQNWFSCSKEHGFVLSEKVLKTDAVPVGSVEFVLEFLANKNIFLKPLNVPESLFKYAGRKIINGTEKDVVEESFVKSNDKIKSYANITTKPPKGNYQISEVVDVDSEYRCFVFQNKLVGLQNYSGSFETFPCVKTIKSMIANYKDSPVAYTLDVGINKTGTFVVEVHNFFSCGLYGFSDKAIYPQMLSQAYFEIVKNN